MNLNINNNLEYKVSAMVSQKISNGPRVFNVPSIGPVSAVEAFAAYDAGRMTNDEKQAFQKEWLAGALQLPEGIGMTNEQFIAYLESRQAPILFCFDELNERFGVTVRWEYENGQRIRGIVDDTPANRAATARVNAYIDSVLSSITRNPSHPSHRHIVAHGRN